MKIIDEKDDAAGKVDNANENEVKTTDVRESAVGDAGDEPDPGAVAEGMKLYDKLSRRHRYPNWIDLLAIIGILLVSTQLVQMVAYFVVLPAMKQPVGEYVNLITYSLSFLLAIVFTIVFQRHRGLRKNFVRLNIGKMNLPLVLWGFLLVFIISVVLEPLLALFPEKYLDMIDQAIGSGGWAILTVVVIAPILEEVLFRGLIAGPVKERNGAWAAIFISAAIFGIIHIIPQQVIYAFAIGIVLGYIYVRTGSLAAVIVIHALNNGVAFLSAEITGDATTTLRSMISSDTLYYIIYGGCLVIMIIAALGMIGALKGKNMPWTAIAAVEGNEDTSADKMKNNKKSSGQVDTK